MSNQVKEDRLNDFDRPTNQKYLLRAIFVGPLLASCSEGGGHGDVSFTPPTPLVKPVEETPSSFAPYALAGREDVKIEGEFITEGPLGDLFSGNAMHLGKAKAVFTGDIVASQAILEEGKGKPDLVKGLSYKPFYKGAVPAFLKASDLLADTQIPITGHILSASGEIRSYENGVASVISVENLSRVSSGIWTYDARTGWTVAGESVSLSGSLKVEGDLTGLPLCAASENCCPSIV